jgi:hypothetical protein
MQRMLIVVFDSDPQAYKGLDALKKLDSNGDISLYANAVIKRGTPGVTVEQSADVGPAGTFLGMMTTGSGRSGRHPVPKAVGTRRPESRGSTHARRLSTPRLRPRPRHRRPRVAAAAESRSLRAYGRSLA